MVAITFTASTKMLPEQVIFKEKLEGRIKTELDNLQGKPNTTGVYSVQESVWMNESMMQLWIAQVLTPYLKKKSCCIRPVLLLDSY